MAGVVRGSAHDAEPGLPRNYCQAGPSVRRLLSGVEAEDSAPIRETDRPDGIALHALRASEAQSARHRTGIDSNKMDRRPNPNTPYRPASCWADRTRATGLLESTITRHGPQSESNRQSVECVFSEEHRRSGLTRYDLTGQDSGAYQDRLRGHARERGTVVDPMSGSAAIDAALDEWGSRLFNLSPVVVPRQPHPATGLPLSRRHAPTPSVPRQPAAVVRQKLRELVRRTPQVMVKLAKAPKGMRGISNNLSYISREGQLDLEDQDGQIIRGREAVADLKTEWQHGGCPVSTQATKREAFHLVLSMPQRTDAFAVQRAARDFAAREFGTFQYVMVLHTFETDPDPTPSPHPHVHLTVKAAGFDGRRLNPRKPDLQRWREGFAEALREQGIEATTTSRLHRPRPARWTVRHTWEPQTQTPRLDRQMRSMRAPRKERELMANYHGVMRALAASMRGDDRQLATDLVRFLAERTPRPVKAKEPDRDR